MKKLTSLFSLLIVALLSLNAQEYVPFPTKNVNWNIFYDGTCEEAPPEKALIRYTLQGDTTLNGYTYTLLCREKGDTINPTVTPIGGLREEDKRIYFVGNPTDIYYNKFYAEYEYLLYDFNVEIGDTIYHIPGEQDYFKSAVLDIDSILIGDSYRKRYMVDNNWFYHQFDEIVEGIGSIKNGLLGHITDIPTCGTHYWEHICFREDGLVKYLNPNFDECFPSYLLNAMEDLVLHQDIEITPNPFNYELRITNRTHKTQLTFYLLDMQGKTMVKQPINSQEEVININVLPGIYIAQIIDNEGNVLIAKKLIKQ